MEPGAIFLNSLNSRHIFLLSAQIWQLFSWFLFRDFKGRFIAKIYSKTYCNFEHLRAHLKETKVIS